MLGTGLLCLFFTYYAMLQCSNFCPIMLNIHLYQKIYLYGECYIRVHQVHNKYSECSIRIITSMVSVLLGYIDHN